MKKVLSVSINCVAIGLILFSPIAASMNYLEMRVEDLPKINIFSGNVLSTHIHNTGEWMIGYNAMYMDMDGLRDGNNHISHNEVLADPRFDITPTFMGMHMHRVHAMYAPTDDLTLMAMLPWVEKWMDHTTITGLNFRTKSSGIGDIKFKGNYVLNRMSSTSETHVFILTAGLSFPTGSIQNKDFIRPAGRVQTLPYIMQLGSGTYDPIIGLTYFGLVDNFHWGLQGMADIRIGENDHHYRLGNQYTANTWFNFAWMDYFSTSVRVEASFIGNIHGQDPRITGFIPTADPNLQANTRVTVFLGSDLFVTEGTFEEFRVGIEVGKPVYQYLDGPQLETDWLVRFGLQYKW